MPGGRPTFGNTRRARPTAGSPLTPRETEVMTLVAEGLSNKLIADRLGLHDQTAKFHVANALAKLGSSTRAGAAVKFLIARMITECPNCAFKPAVPARMIAGCPYCAPKPAVPA